VELQGQYEAIRESGAEVVALVVAPAEAVENWCQSAGVDYPVLADPEGQVSEAYDVFNLLGDLIAAPSLFIIETDGRVVWGHIGQSPRDYVSGQAILEHLP